MRSFKVKRASWKAVINAVNAAAQAPYAGNKNNVKYVVTERDDKIKKIANACEQDWIRDTGIVVVVVSDETLPEEAYGERGRIYSRQQAGAAIQNFLLKITDLGLAACWIGAFNDTKIRNIFEIPEDWNIEAVIPIGYEYGKTPTPTKRPLDSYVYWERWMVKRRATVFLEPEIHDNP